MGLAVDLDPHFCQGEHLLAPARLIFHPHGEKLSERSVRLCSFQYS